MAYIFFNGYIYGQPEALAVLIEGRHISHIGSLTECRSLAKTDTAEIDLKGKALLPSFTDSHTHFVEYAKGRLFVQLNGIDSIQGIKDYLVSYRNALSWDAKWILGGGWDRNTIDHPEQLNKELLDEIFPDIPVALFSKDYHSKLCNSLALKIAGLDEKSKAPIGGKIEKRADGSLTGILYERAAELIDQYIIQPDDRQIIASIKESIKELYRYGLTSFHTLEYLPSVQLLLAAIEEGAKFHFTWHFQEGELDEVLKRGYKSYEADECFQVGGLKLFGDGSLGSGTAAMLKPFSDDEDNYGILRYTDSMLYELAKEAAINGFPITFHAIGDRAVRQYVRTIVKLKEEVKESRKLCYRLEHAQAIDREDIALLKQSGIVLSLQPVHLSFDIAMIKKKWANTQNNAFLQKTLIDEGIEFIFGSDAPIETINPFLGIYTAFTRKEGLNPNSEPFNEREKISIEEAINAYTIDAARASNKEDFTGKIAGGYSADLMVIEDYRKLTEDYWLDAESYLTMLAGEIVYNKLY